MATLLSVCSEPLTLTSEELDVEFGYLTYRGAQHTDVQLVVLEAEEVAA